MLLAFVMVRQVALLVPATSGPHNRQQWHLKRPGMVTPFRPSRRELRAQTSHKCLCITVCR